MAGTRTAYYTCVDSAFIHTVKRFIDSQSQRALTQFDWYDFQGQWCRWLEKYIHERCVDDMPPSWSPSEPLPISTIVTEGDAGTGKTYSNNTLLRTLTDGTVTAFAAKGTDAYLDYMIGDTMPGSADHVEENKTICRTFSIRFGDAKVRHVLEGVKNNGPLQETYRRLHTCSTGGQEVDTNATRAHLAEAAYEVWPLFAECYAEITKHFVKGSGFVRRRIIRDERHPHYTGDRWRCTLAEEVHEKCMEKITNNPIERDKLIEDTARAVTQDAYRVLCTCTGSLVSPPQPVLHPVMLYEEDGMVPAFYGTLRKLLTLAMAFLYLPPYIFSRPPIIITSGSTTQSSAIAYPASALEMAVTPIHLADRATVLPYRAEFFRRGTDDFDNADVVACRTTCLTLERHLPQSQYTYSALLAHQEHDTLVEDPAHCSSGTRLYTKHDAVRLFTNRLKLTGKADVEVTDTVFVADNVVPFQQNNHMSPNNDDLSSKTTLQAAAFRAQLWDKKKRSVYAQLEPFDERLPRITYDDEQLNPDAEETVTSAQEKVAEGFALTAGVATEQGPTDAGQDIEYDRVVRQQDEVVSGKRKVEDTDESNTMFIAHRARYMLSAKEHANKRMFANAIADGLGDGTRLAKRYLSGSKVVDQTGNMEYDPSSDIVVEYGDGIGMPDARILYMAFKRKRLLVRNAPVTNESPYTLVEFRGVTGTLKTIRGNALYMERATTEFKCLVCALILEKFAGYLSRDTGPRCPVDSAIVQQYQEAMQSAIDSRATLATLEGLIMRVCERTDTTFYEEVHQEIYVDRCSLFPLWRYRACRAVRLSTLRLNAVGDVQLIGNGTNACTDVWRHGLEANVVADTPRYPQSLLGRETGGGLRETQILWATVEAVTPATYIECVTTLLLDGVVLATTKPRASSSVRWSSLLDSPKKAFGVLMRTRAAGLGVPKARLVNGVFRSCGGDLMHLPRPFKHESVNTPTNVILKGRVTVVALAKRFLGLEDEIRLRRLEALMVCGIVNPLYGTPASTVAAAQGSTNSGKILINLQSIGKQNELVGFTRSTNVQNIRVASVTTNGQETAAERTSREVRRARVSRLVPKYYFRQ